MSLRKFVIGAMLLGPSLASAEAIRQRPVITQGRADMFGFVGMQRDDGTTLARQVLPAGSTSTDGSTTIAALAQSRVIFLNKSGVTLTPGNNDARTNRSTIVTQQTTIPAW